MSISKAQRQAPAPGIAGIVAAYRDRNATIVAAYATGAYNYREIPEHFGVHLATVGRIVRKEMQQCGN